jgi:hypothetical protein
MDMTAKLTALDIWSDIEKVRTHSPLVHSITNHVVMNFNANVLLAAGASPVMAHAHEEVAEMVTIAQALVLNIGTLDPYWIESMRLALVAATRRGIPVVLDPVCDLLPQSEPCRTASGGVSQRDARQWFRDHESGGRRGKNPRCG